MKYRVSGQNRDNGSRMTLEMEALSRGAAERKAQQAGMDVHRVEEIGGSLGVPHNVQARPSRAGRKIILLLVVLVLLAAAGFVFKDYIWAIFNQ